MTENKISNKDKENKNHRFSFNSSDLMSDKDKTSPAYQLVKDIDGYTLVYATDPQTGAECYVTKSGINYRLNSNGKPVINKKYVIAKTDFNFR